MPGNKTKLFFETWQVFIAYIGKQILPFVSRQSIITPSDTKTTGQPLLQAEAKKPFSQALHPAYESSFWKVSFSMNETVTKRFLLYFRLMMVAWILIANAFFHAIEFEYSWLIFLSNIMLFTMEGDIKDRFISVELGGLVGMVLTVLAMLAIGTLTPVLGGMLGLLLPLGVVLFILIILHPQGAEQCGLCLPDRRLHRQRNFCSESASLLRGVHRRLSGLQRRLRTAHEAGPLSGRPERQERRQG